ncbi:DUF3450 domain-containing protein [Halodesulfovibrio aestuarii]|uniref:DUF3450 domain-containing protein n=1 Tax=Halodesulfovibrio aestuarii TaxID=126333 RepID=A0A8G2CBI0_9BACT|nr:DUF3450 domain-containing protein [Halodesulfovibrio aestuarii]SHJ56389.1 Protein of unknown function [Halodesulfovibrio aestuarii]
MFQYFYRVFSFIIGGLLLLSPFAYANPEQATQLISATISTEQKAQKEIQKWQQEKQSVIAQIDNKQFELDWLTYQNKKYARYIEKIKANIDEMKRQQQELNVIANTIDPLLGSTVTRLKNFIAQDQPFLSVERHERIANIQSALADPHTSQAERLRRVLEALEIETAYGDSIELGDEQVVFNGTPLHATTLRAGRLGYYCISPDKTEVGFWNPEQKQFTALDKKNAQLVLNLQTIARRKQIVEITPLPILTGNVKENSTPPSTSAVAATKPQGIQ